MTDKSPIENLADITRQQTELELTRAFFDAVLSTSASIDKVATWLLAGLGATVALIIANLEKTNTFLGAGHLSELILLLLVAGLFGLAEKYLAIRVHIQIHVDKKARQAMSVIFGKHENQKDEIEELAKQSNVRVNVEIDAMKPILEIKKIVPWYQRMNFEKNFKRGLKDQLYGHKHAARFYNRQVAYAVLQLLVTVFAVILIAVNV